MKGEIKFFNPKKGYGFVKGENGHDAFVHFSNIVMEGNRILQSGDKVEYEETVDDKGLKAINVKLV